MILPPLPHGASRLAGQFAEQAKLAFAKLETALAVAGAKPADLVKLNYYVLALNHEKLVSCVRRATALSTRTALRQVRSPACRPFFVTMCSWR